LTIADQSKNFVVLLLILGAVNSELVVWNSAVADQSKNVVVLLLTLGVVNSNFMVLTARFGTES
jgi:hypothetical protein